MRFVLPFIVLLSFFSCYGAVRMYQKQHHDFRNMTNRIGQRCYRTVTASDSFSFWLKPIFLWVIANIFNFKLCLSTWSKVPRRTRFNSTLFHWTRDPRGTWTAGFLMYFSRWNARPLSEMDTNPPIVTFTGPISKLPTPREQQIRN